MRVIGLRIFAAVCLVLFPFVCFACACETMIRERAEYHELWVIFWRLFTGKVTFIQDDDDDENRRCDGE